MLMQVYLLFSMMCASLLIGMHDVCKSITYDQFHIGYACMWSALRVFNTLLIHVAGLETINTGNALLINGWVQIL